MSQTLKILKQYWNYDSFRKPQEDIINAILDNENVIALLPTGGGKSICFQVPTMIFEGVCIVISPLIALMKDQVNTLNKKGIKATTIDSGLNQDDLITLFDTINFGNYKFLYISPERLQSRFIQEKIKQLQVSLIAIDEAHCISEWGHDFRPSYRNIKIIQQLKPNTPTIALTATATKKVLHDISTSLELNHVAIFKKSFYKENLAYQFFYTEDKLQRLLQICKKNNSPIIIYVKSRNKAKEISNFLNANQFVSCYYHGGLAPYEKQEAFDNWMLEKAPIIVATNAFGMGIDKSNVKVVVHLDFPTSIENYIQEAGRAGRNGNKAFSVVLYNNDIRVYKEQLATTYPSIKEVKIIYKSLSSHFQIAKGEKTEEKFSFDFISFCNKYNFNTKKVNTTIKLLSNYGILNISDNYNQKSSIQFLITSKQALNYSKSENLTSKIIQILLRSYGGIFEQETKINEYWLAKKASILSKKIVEILDKLHSEKIIEYKKVTQNSQLEFLVPREDDITINNISKNISKYIKQKINKVDKLIKLIDNDTICRSKQILNYFDESTTKDCGICDVCLQNKNTVIDISEKILLFLEEHKYASSKKICEIIPESDTTILVNLHQLLAEEKININNSNQYYIP